MNTNSNVFLALVTGTAIGSLIAMLYAPKKGLETRRSIADSAEMALDAISRAAEELKGKAEEVYTDEKETFESRIDSIIANAHYRPQEVIAALETKLKKIKRKVARVRKKPKAKTTAKKKKIS